MTSNIRSAIISSSFCGFPQKWEFCVHTEAAVLCPKGDRLWVKYNYEGFSFRKQYSENIYACHFLFLLIIYCAYRSGGSFL